MYFPSASTNGRKMMKFTALLLIGAAALANAGPVARDTCATICDVAQTKFNVEPGKTYVYDYEGESLTKIEGASEEVSGLHVKTTARIHALTPCELQLELRGTELSHLTPNDPTAKTASPVGGAFKDALEANTIRFGSNNGAVERICGAERDPAWVLNIKRAIISALQNNMADLKTETTIRESDVVGTCDTVYKTMEDGSIVKTKNLLGCMDREYINTMIQHGHYIVPSEIQGIPVLKSEHTCKQIVREGVIAEVECTESHIARAFSNGEAGAATTLKTKMILKEAVAEKVAPMAVAFTAPIAFDMTKTEREIKDAAAFIKAAITEICAAGVAEDKSPERFAKLIKNVQAVDATTLTKLHQELAPTICKLGKKTFHDVLPLAGTSAAVSVMKDILLAGEIQGVEADMWKSALAFIPNPNEEMIAHITPLLAKADRKVYLSTSTMVRNFCLNRKDCAAVKEVQDFIKVLEAHIGTDGSGPEDVVLMSIKALGNAGVALNGKMALIKCIKNEKISMDLRIAALEAFRHMKLGSIKTELLAIYKDMELDPEIRIGAFVALMRDPCKMCIDTVQATMAKERVLQVGSFVMSFMENARRNENPTKREVNAILRMFDETLIKRDWNLERMKYSRAYEGSYFSSYLNAGLDAESHVIFSPAGFLPRQVKTDLNINLFGRSINLLEVGARMEGLENILEYYFGPSGPLAETGVGRTKRAALDTEQIDKIQEEVKSRSILKEARGLMYLKMFGSELGYQNFDLESILRKKDNINVLELLKAIAKNHEQEYTQNFQLMDLTYTIPTILGLPLKLDLNAHGTMHLKVGGKLDIVKLMQPPRNLDIDGYIRPSAAIEVRTEMGIDAFLTQTGIKMVANLHTATSVEGKILLKDGKVFKVHYAVPKTEQEIFHGMTKFFVRHHNTEREQRMITKDAISMEKCTGETLATVTGLKMCGGLRLPNALQIKSAPYFPLTGPVNMRLAIMKTDPKLTSYNFEASRTSVDGVESLKLILDTPGSEINRELATIVTLNTAQKALDINIRSPWKKIHAAASLVDQDDLKKLTTKLVVDEEREYSAVATVALQKENDVMKIIPEFNVIMNGKNPLKAGGMITIQKNSKIVADLKIENLTEKPITLVGSLEQVIGEQLRVNHELTFTSPLMTFATKGFVEKQRVKLIVRSENSFKFRDGKEHKMTIDTKLHSEKRKDVQIFNILSNLVLSDFPDHNLGLGIDFKKTSENTKFNVEATFKKDTKPIKFTNVLTHKFTSPVNVGLKSEIELPTVELTTEHKLTQTAAKEFKFFSLTTLNKAEKVKSEFTLTLAETEDLKAELMGYFITPFAPKMDIIIRPTLSKTAMELFMELKYENHVHNFVLSAKKEGANAINGHCHLLMDADRYESNINARIMSNLIDIKADLKIKEKTYEASFNAAMEKTAIKIQTIMTTPENKVELNIGGEMTGEAIKGHIDAALNEKKVEANLDYFRKDLNLKLLANINGLTHLKSKIGAISIKIHNEFTGNDLATLVEAKADDQSLVVLALKGAMTTESLTANVKLTALTMTVAGDITVTWKEGAYSALLTATLPKRTVGFEVKYGGNKANGYAGVVINLNKNEEGNTFEYHLKWSRAAPKDRTQFVGELLMKQPVWLFPFPVKFTTLFSRDILGTYKADLTLDYGLKFQLKAIHKMLPIGIESNVEIITPIEGYEKMTGELVATMTDNKLNFKFGAVHNKNVIEVILTGMADKVHQELDFSLKTPFKGLEIITATLKNKMEELEYGFNIDTTAELKWGINKKVAIIFAHKMNDMANINGKLTIVIPVENYETTTMEYGLTTKGDTRNLLVKLVWNMDKVVELTLVHTMKPDVKMGFVLESVLKTPVMDDLKMTIDFAYKPMRLFALDVKGMLGEKVVTLVAKAEKTETKIDATLTFKTPMNPEGTSASFLFNDPNGGKNLDATLTLTLSPKKIITLATYMKKEDWTQTEGKIEFTSFFADKVVIDFGWHMNKADRTLKTNVVLEYVPGKKITIELDLMHKETDVTFTFKTTTPIDPLRLFRYHVKSTGGFDNLNTHIEGQINDMLVSTDLLAKIVSWTNFEVTLTHNAPIRNYEKTSLSVSIKPTEHKITAMASLLLKGNTWAVEAITQELVPNHIEHFLTISTPIANWEKTEFYFSNKGHPTDMLTKASVTLAGKKWMVELTTRFVALKDMFFNLALTSPLKNLEKITIELAHKGTWENMVSKIVVATPKIAENPATIELVAKIVKLTNMEAKLSLKGLETIGVEPIAISMSNRGETIKPLLTIMSVTVGPKVYTLTSTLNFEAITDMEGSLVLTTPIEKYERVGLTWTNKVADGKKDAKLVIEFQTEQRVTIEGHVKKTGPKFEIRFTITTPFPAFDKADFALDFTGTLSDFASVLIIELPKIRKTEIHLSNKLDLSKGISQKGAFRIDCIFFSTTAIENSFELKDNVLKLDTTFGYGLKKGAYTLDAKLVKDAGITFEMTTTLTSDWTEAKSAAFAFTLVKKETIKITTLVKVNDIELITLTFEHFPAMKCILTLKQRLIEALPVAWEFNSDIKATIAESLIKFSVATDGAPLASLEFSHTYAPKSLAAKLDATYKTLKTEGSILISEEKGTYLIKVDAIKGEAKILEFITAYEPAAETHVVKVKAVYEGKTLVDIVFKFKPDMKDAAVEVQESGKNILGLRGKLIDHTLEVHVAWLDTPIIDLKTEFKPTPLTFAIELKYKGELILNTRGTIDLKDNALDAHIKWNEAPLIDLKTEFKAMPYIFNMEFKYLGNPLLITKNALDIKARTIKAMINIDNILKMFLTPEESWVLSLEGNMVQRRDLTTLVMDIKKAEKLIRMEVSLKTTGKIDLTLRPAALTIDFKVSTKGLTQDHEIAFVLDLKKNADLMKTSFIALLDKVEKFNTVVELKKADTKITLLTDMVCLPYINSALKINLDKAEALDFEILLITDKALEKETTMSLNGRVELKPNAILFNINAGLPSRKVSLTFKHVLANRNLEHMVSLSWEAGKTTGYSFTLADRSKSGAIIYNLVGEFTHPIRTIKYTAKMEASPRKYLLALDVLPDASIPERKTFFKVDVTDESNGEMINLKAETTIGHPSLTHPITLTKSLTLNRQKILIATSFTLAYSESERNHISGSLRIMKENEFHYTLVAELKQPINFVDIRVNALIKRPQPGMIQQETSVSYFTSKRETKTVILAILADLPGKKAEIRITTPTLDRKVSLVVMDKMTAEGRHARLVLTHEDINAKALTRLIDVELNEINRAFRAEVGDFLKIDAGMHDKYMVRLTIIAKEKKIILFKTNFKDATHMLINTRLEWDAALLETIKTEIPPIAAKVSGALVSTWEPVAKDILADIEAKIAAFQKVGINDFKPIFEAWRKFVEALDKDVTTAIEGLKQMWRENEFYLKDAGKVLLASWDRFMVTYKEVEAKFWLRHQEVMAYLEKNHVELMAQIRDLEAIVKGRMEWFHAEFTRVRAQIETGLKEIRPRVEAAVREHLEMAEKEIEALIREYEPKIKTMVADLMKTIGHLRKNVILPLIAKMEETYVTLARETEAWIVPLKARMAALKERICAEVARIRESGLAKTLEELRVQLERKYATTTAAIVEWLQEVNAKVEAAFKEWEAYPQVAEFKASLELFKEKMVWAWEYIDLPGELAKLAEQMRMKRERFWRIIKDNKSALVVYDKAAGILEFDVEIPIALKELAALPKFDDLMTRLDVARREVVANAPKISWTLMDYYYYWMPRTVSLPPFTATGMIAGNQHFFTFDGSFFEFAGDCSYVLARDFADNKFTVIANYRRTRAGPKRNSLTVMAGDKTIEIFNSFKTVVDKDVTELPLETPEVMVKRMGADHITIESKKGMTVSCHMKTEICTIAVSGWYYGKTGGLLGTYDYEPSTDMTNPMGKRVEDIERFANSWEVAKTCSDKTNYAKTFHKVAHIKNTIAYATCAALFLDDNSVLRPAFRNVDVTPFMNMCVNDVFEWQSHPNADEMMRKKTCTAVTAYITEAELRGIRLEAPAHCYTCNKVAGGEMVVGETERVLKAAEGVDTVVIVEENMCNKNKRKDLLGLISSVQKAYKEQGLKDNMFGLAAFGGAGVHARPHIHTIDGEVMNTDRKFVRGVRALEFSNETPYNFVEGAIEWVAKTYPWRAGMKRAVIVLSCTACSERMPDLDLRAVLSETKVHVHMLRDLELAFRGGKRASNVLGFDRSGVFTTKDTSSKTLEGDAALLAQLAVPKETCIPAIMEGEGSFFTINALSEGRVRDQKKLIDVVSRRVAATATTESCQICECKFTSPFTMRTSNVCKPCKK